MLTAIDGAIADYEVSGDAVRWVPEDARTDEIRSGGTVSASGGWCGPTGTSSLCSCWYELFDVSDPVEFPEVRATRGGIDYAPPYTVMRATELDEAGQPTDRTHVIYGVDLAHPRVSR